jgi:TldD protein
MARLGRQAVSQARANVAEGRSRRVELAPVSPIADGRWVMPVATDPFELHPLEVKDFLAALVIFAGRTPAVREARALCTFVKQEKAFASSVGSYLTQRTYRTSGNLQLAIERDGKRGGGGLSCMSPAGVGWELLRDQPLRDEIRRLIASIEEDLTLPVKPVDVGRFDVVFDAGTVTDLLDETLGRATELDRALGYEANADGTSYITAPLEMVGGYTAGASLLNVSANRSEPGACASVRWDDEGCEPDTFALVKDGILVDFQTTRESAGWLKSYYDRSGKPFRSHGCATCTTAVDAPLQRSPNLMMAPGREALDFDDLVAGVATGLAVRSASVDMDFQHLSGMVQGAVYQVKRGKRVARISGAALLIRAPELWKGLLALGGAASARRYGAYSDKGEPAQRTYHSVTAVPAAFKQLTLIDAERRA